MTAEMARDYDLIQQLWKVLRAFGDIQNIPEQEARWNELGEMVNQIGREHRDAHKVIYELHNMLQNRANAKLGNTYMI